MPDPGRRGGAAALAPASGRFPRAVGPVGVVGFVVAPVPVSLPPDPVSGARGTAHPLGPGRPGSATRAPQLGLGCHRRRGRSDGGDRFTQSPESLAALQPLQHQRGHGLRSRSPPGQ